MISLISSGSDSNSYSKSVLSPSGNRAFGELSVNSFILVPRPAARITACMASLYLLGACEQHENRPDVLEGRFSIHYKPDLVLVVRDIGTNFLDDVGCSFFAAQPKGKAKCKRERDDDASEKRLQ